MSYANGGMLDRLLSERSTTGYNPENHFRGVTKLIIHGKGGQPAETNIRSVIP